MKMKQFLLAICLVAGLTASATPAFFTPWTPIFRGVDLATGTNFSGGAPIFAHAMRVDLTDPTIKLLASPKNTNNLSYESVGQSVSNYLKTYQLQVAINANQSDVEGSEGGAVNMAGLMITKGVVISPQDDSSYTAGILFTTSNVPYVILTNSPPGTNTAGIYTAATGFYPLVWNGVNMCLNGAITGLPNDGSIHGKQPRTTMGVSQDNHYLYLICIDGRQYPFSDGSTDVETADMMILFGVYHGIKMDGGGSATMVMANSLGNPVEVNRSSYSLGYGSERVVGSHFGVFAQALPGFINDVVINALDTTATVNWTTLSNSTSRVEFGTTPSFGSATALDTNLVSVHSQILTGLTASVTYYYRISSVFNGTTSYFTGQFTTPHFTITISTPVFGVTNSWKWTTQNLEGTNWMAPSYNDSGWGNGPGLLFVENSLNGVTPLSTPLPPNNGVQTSGVAVSNTYYFRTTFNYTNSPLGTALLFTNFIDDGAVFYLNGVEIQRVRMPGGPVTYSTLATTFPCNGDANCANAFTISGDLVTNLITGTNILAVEVHQYVTTSPDIVFGSSLTANFTYSTIPKLNIMRAGNVTTLSWIGTAYTLQQCPQMSLPTNVWTDVPGPVITSPFSITNSPATKFYRLRN